MSVRSFEITVQRLAEKRLVLAGAASSLGRLEDALLRRSEQLATLTGDLDAIELRLQQLKGADGVRATLLAAAIDSAWAELEGALAQLSSEGDDGPGPEGGGVGARVPALFDAASPARLGD